MVLAKSVKSSPTLSAYNNCNKLLQPSGALGRQKPQNWGAVLASLNEAYMINNMLQLYY